jgi:protein disulfide-isomerase
LVLATACDAGAEEAKWLTSAKQAAALSRQTGRPILADFTGSDWCSFCQMLEAEVFGTAEFQTWAKDNVVLLQLDFPRRTPQSKELAEQNATLKARYGIDGFPTVVFLDGRGKELGRTGYLEGGVANWIAAAEKIANRTVQTHGTLTEGLAAAKAAGKPLLVFLHQATDQKAGEQLKRLVRYVDLMNFTETFAEVSAVATAADGPQTDERKAVDALVEKAEAAGAGLHSVLLDAAGEKMLHMGALAADTDVSKFVGQLLDAMPEVAAYEGGWVEDFGKAWLIARQQKRIMFVDFMGSNWCGWCKRLDEEIVSTDDFQKAAKGKLVMVKLDFPKPITLLDEATRRQNLRLFQQLRVDGFPTVVILDGSAEELGRMGYMQGGPKPFLKELKGIIEKAN